MDSGSSIPSELANFNLLNQRLHEITLKVALDMGIRGSLVEGRVQPAPPPPDQRAEHCPLLRDEKTTAAHPLTNNLSCTHSNLKAQCSARDQIALNVEGAIDRCMCGEESLRRTGGIEALHPSFSLPYRQMRILGPIVDPSAGDVASLHGKITLCCAI